MFDWKFSALLAVQLVSPVAIFFTLQVGVSYAMRRLGEERVWMINLGLAAGCAVTAIALIAICAPGLIPSFKRAATPIPVIDGSWIASLPEPGSDKPGVVIDAKNSIAIGADSIALGWDAKAVWPDAKSRD